MAHFIQPEVFDNLVGKDPQSGNYTNVQRCQLVTAQQMRVFLGTVTRRTEVCINENLGFSRYETSDAKFIHSIPAAYPASLFDEIVARLPACRFIFYKVENDILFITEMAGRASEHYDLSDPPQHEDKCNGQQVGIPCNHLGFPIMPMS